MNHDDVPKALNLIFQGLWSGTIPIEKSALMLKAIGLAQREISNGIRRDYRSFYSGFQQPLANSDEAKTRREQALEAQELLEELHELERMKREVREMNR